MMIMWMIEDPTAGILVDWDGEKPTFSWSKPRGDPKMMTFVSSIRATEALRKIVTNNRYRNAFVRSWSV